MPVLWEGKRMSMIEQVAKGMRLRDFCRAAKLDANDPEALAFEAAWATAGPFIHNQWLTLARAAIEAMREPTPEMLKPKNDDLAYFDMHRADDAAGIWRAMIDAALNSGKQSA
jgi:hypothetical protein